MAGDAAAVLGCPVGGARSLPRTAPVGGVNDWQEDADVCRTQEGERTNAMTAPHVVQARATRRFRASAEEVFDAWLDPALVREWFGPGLGEMTRVDIDARVGGTFWLVQRRAAGDAVHTGEYLEIDPPRRLVFTWRTPPLTDTSRVIVDIQPLASRLRRYCHPRDVAGVGAIRRPRGERVANHDGCDGEGRRGGLTPCNSRNGFAKVSGADEFDAAYESGRAHTSRSVAGIRWTTATSSSTRSRRLRLPT